MVYTRKAFHCAGVRARSKGEGWRARGMQLPQHIALCILRETWQLFGWFPTADKLYWSQETGKKPLLPEYCYKKPICTPINCQRAYLLDAHILFCPPHPYNVQKTHLIVNCRLTCRRTERNHCACNDNRRDHCFFWSLWCTCTYGILGSPGNTNMHKYVKKVFGGQACASQKLYN